MPKQLAGLRWLVCRSNWLVCAGWFAEETGWFADARARGVLAGLPYTRTIQGRPGRRLISTRSGSSRAPTPPAKVIHISTGTTPPSPRPPPLYRRHQSISLLGSDRTGRPRRRARHPSPAATPPVFACTYPDRLATRVLLHFHRAATRHARLAPVGGAARQAPDDRRHGDAGRLRLRDTAPEVGEGGAHSGLVEKADLGRRASGCPGGRVRTGAQSATRPASPAPIGHIVRRSRPPALPGAGVPPRSGGALLDRLSGLAGARKRGRPLKS